MSKTIEVSEQDYARIRDAADADGMPLGEWVVANLPLEQRRTDIPAATPCAEPKAGRTMADRFAGRLGLVASEGEGSLSENTGEKFTDYLEDKRRAGIL